MSDNPVWNAVQTFLSNPWVGYALGVLLIVWQFKMNQTWSNLMLIAAVLLLIVSAFRTPPIDQQEIVPRILWTALFAVIVSLVAYYLLWTRWPSPPQSYPHFSSNGHPQGDMVAGISWRAEYSELTVIIQNPSDQYYDDLVLRIRPDVWTRRVTRKFRLSPFLTYDLHRLATCQ
jgi:hypothetical protein